VVAVLDNVADVAGGPGAEWQRRSGLGLVRRRDPNDNDFNSMVSPLGLRGEGLCFNDELDLPQSTELLVVLECEAAFGGRTGSRRTMPQVKSSSMQNGEVDGWASSSQNWNSVAEEALLLLLASPEMAGITSYDGVMPFERTSELIEGREQNVGITSGRFGRALAIGLWRNRVHWR
jgi:hypothetical protein